MLNMSVWVVSYLNSAATEAIVSVFCEKAAAASYYRYIVESKRPGASMQECEILRVFDPTDNTPIETLNLSNRATLCLRRNGINTIDELLALDEQTIREIRGIGVSLFDEIVENVHASGRKMGWEED